MRLTYLTAYPIILFSALAQASSLDLSLHPGDMGTGHIEARVTFDGQMDNCTIDTGARKTTIKSHILADAPIVKKIPTGGITGVEQMADLVQAAEIQSNDWIKKNLLISRVEKLPANCLIGNDFFMQESLFIDYTRKKIETDVQFDGDTFVLNHYADQWFGFTAEFSGQVVDTLFDTGAGITVVDDTLVEEFPDNFEFLQKTELIDAAEQKREASVYKMKTLKFGIWEKQDVLVLAYSFATIHEVIPSVRIVIGHNIINEHRWYINNQTKVWSAY